MLRITVGDITLEAIDLDGIRSLIGIIGELPSQVSHKPSLIIPLDEEKTLRAEYAASRGLSQVRLTEGILAGKTPLEFLREWKAKQASGDDGSPLIVPNDDGGTVY